MGWTWNRIRGGDWVTPVFCIVGRESWESKNHLYYPCYCGSPLSKRAIKNPCLRFGARNDPGHRRILLRQGTRCPLWVGSLLVPVVSLGPLTYLTLYVSRTLLSLLPTGPFRPSWVPSDVLRRGLHYLQNFHSFRTASVGSVPRLFVVTSKDTSIRGHVYRVDPLLCRPSNRKVHVFRTSSLSLPPNFPLDLSDRIRSCTSSLCCADFRETFETSGTCLHSR